MNVPSSISPIELGGEAKRHWFMFLVFLTLAIIFGMIGRHALRY